MSKAPKQLSNGPKRTETSVILIVIYAVPDLEQMRPRGS